MNFGILSITTTENRSRSRVQSPDKVNPRVCLHRPPRVNHGGYFPQPLVAPTSLQTSQSFHPELAPRGKVEGKHGVPSHHCSCGDLDVPYHTARLSILQELETGIPPSMAGSVYGKRFRWWCIPASPIVLFSEGR